MIIGQGEREAADGMSLAILEDDNRGPPVIPVEAKR